VIGVAVGTALLPLLSRQLRAGDDAAAAGSMNRALEFALLLTVPGAVALIVMPDLVVSVLFERGAFGAAETSATSAALAAYAIGLPAYVLIKVLAPGFFAREDTATPVKIAALCVAINLVLNLVLMGPLLHVGIALATAISAWVNAGLLAWMLMRRGYFVADSRLRRAVPRTLLASVAMAGILWFAAGALADVAAIDPTREAFVLALLVGLGLVAFGAGALCFGAARIADIKRLLDRSPG
jgi:putative peptidoglycan lipid II flippase